jgi:type VI secretion system protein ImpD
MNTGHGEFQGNAAMSADQVARPELNEGRGGLAVAPFTGAGGVPLDADAVSPSRPATLLDTVLEGTRAREGPARNKLEEFLRESSPAKALALWIGWVALPGATLDKDRIARLLGRDIARLDELLTRQVNAILHHRGFQRLEASWRGLRYLVEQSGEAENVKIQVLSVSWKELVRDAERAIEFDQSQLFRKIYSDEFGTPGGEPFSVLLGDYQIRPFPSADHPTDDVAALEAISHVAAAAFAPFIAAPDPAMFGLDDFAELQQPLNISKTFEQLEYLKWRAFRDTEDSRFIGLTLPRVLMRLPYEDDGSRVDGFRFREETEGPGRGKYLWGNAAYAFGAVLIRSFDRSGWLASIRGVSREGESGGLVPNLPVHAFSTDKRGVAPKCSTDVVVTDLQEHELSDLGFIPLCHCADTELSAFYANQSVQKPKFYDEQAATMNARISAMLQYMLCVSRFAHYLKVAARDKIGSFTEAEECEDYLHRWLQHYVTGDSEASPEVKAEYPLREASVRVREQPGKPGSYLCVAHLWPHYELDELVATVKVTTELTPGVPL